VSDSDLSAQINSLRRLLEQGVLSEDIYRAALVGLGVDASTVFDQRDRRIEQQVNIAGTYIDRRMIVSELGASPEALRRAYLHRLVQQTRRLPLAGVDPKAAGDEWGRELQLSTVYTALLTRQPEGSTFPKAPGFREGETRYLSALEMLNREPRLVLLGEPGSGKSTFVNFVALCLAGEVLGDEDANLAALTAPLPAEKRDKKPQPQPWDHGPLLPVRVVLRDLAARGLPASGRRVSGNVLWNFIASELGETLSEYAPLLKTELLEQGGLILLDGLDEVPDAHQRREQVKQAVQDFAACFPRCRFLVTSRIYAYQRQDWKLERFVEVVLSPFTPAQVARFVDGWYAHVGALRAMDARDAQGRATLLKTAIQRSERLAELAAHPLLLTLMASLHAWRGGSLPEKREELYADAVDLLLDQWESPKVVRDAAGQPLVGQPSLAEWLKVDRAVVRAELNRLAFEAHRDQPQLVGTADLPQERLVGGLMGVARNPDVNPARLLEYVRDRAGLLVARGEGIYAFPHRTFQQYLAACYLVDVDYPRSLVRLLRDDYVRWQEIALLAAARAARGTSSATWVLVEALCPYDFPPPLTVVESDWHVALLASQLLIESGEYTRVPEQWTFLLNRLREWLAALPDSGMPKPECKTAEKALEKLGGVLHYAGTKSDDEAILFFERAGFRVTSVRKSIHRCESIPSRFHRLLSRAIYIRILASQVLDAKSVLAIQNELHGIDPTASVVVVVTDQRPTDQGWAQIGTLQMGGFVILPLERMLIGRGLATGREKTILHTEIEKRLGADYDPYDVRNPVAGAFGFFGRVALMDRVLRRIIVGQPVGIFGLRKMGKSSLLQALRNRCPFPVATVNLQTLEQATLGELYRRILEYWGQWVITKYSLGLDPPTIAPHNPTESFVAATIEILHQLESHQHDVRLGLFLDEAELIVPRLDGGGADLQRYLTFSRAVRGLIDENGRLSLVIASLNPSINRIGAWDVEQNPIFSLLQEIYLPPLTQEDCVQMTRNIGRQVNLIYSDQSLDAVAVLSGGHPFLARQLCSVLYRQRDRQPGQIEADAISPAVEHFIYDDQTVTHLDAGIWQDAGNPALWREAQAQVNQVLLLELARADDPVPQDDLLDNSDADLRRTALINLERFHFIHQPEPGVYSLRYGLLRTWLRRRKLGLE